MAARPRGREHLLSAGRFSHLPIGVDVTKAEEIYTKVEEKVAEGMTKPDAFRELATALGIKYDSVRGGYYTHKKLLDGGGSPSRPRRRETTPEDAVADARATLERALESIDREVATAEERAKETKAEFEEMKESAPERKKAIQAKLDVLSD
jgi:hypothetical protein